MVLFITFNAIFLVGVGTLIWKKEATWSLANFPKDEAKKYSMLPMIIFIPATSLLVILFIVGRQRLLYKN